MYKVTSYPNYPNIYSLALDATIHRMPELESNLPLGRAYAWRLYGNVCEKMLERKGSIKSRVEYVSSHLMVNRRKARKLVHFLDDYRCAFRYAPHEHLKSTVEFYPSTVSVGQKEV